MSDPNSLVHKALVGKAAHHQWEKMNRLEAMHLMSLKVKGRTVLLDRARDNQDEVDKKKDRFFEWVASEPRFGVRPYVHSPDIVQSIAAKRQSIPGPSKVAPPQLKPLNEWAVEIVDYFGKTQEFADLWQAEAGLIEGEFAGTAPA